VESSFFILDFLPKIGTRQKELLMISIIHSCLERYLVRIKIFENFTRFQVAFENKINNK